MATAKKRSQKKNLPTGSLIYLGDYPDIKAKVVILRRSGAEFKEIVLKREEITKEEILNPDNLWIHFCGLADVETVKVLFNALNIHKLAQEDIVSGIQRPKLEDYNDYLLVTANHLSSSDAHLDPNYGQRLNVNSISSEQISALVFSDKLFTFEDGIEDLYQITKKKLSLKSNILLLKPDFILYTLLDAIVDNFFTVLEKLGEDSEKLQESIIREPAQELLKSAFDLKHDLLTVRRAVWPLREALSSLQRGSHHSINRDSSIYYRDVYDHAVEVLDITENLREMTSNMVDIYLSSINNNLNSVMKVLAIITTIFMPLTLITGIYGMNFDNMPELRNPNGYYGVLVVMFLVVCFMLVFFRKKRWI